MGDWHDLFHAGESPYFAMFTAGRQGVPIEEISAYLSTLGIPLRAKDARNWQDGRWYFDCKQAGHSLDPVMRQASEYKHKVTIDSDFNSFQRFPENWMENNRRWFPCTMDNAPMQKWGYREDFTPQLYDKVSAEVLSPRRWVGQNLYLQPFIVLDIDGVGHGCVDNQVIAFGNKYRNQTECWEDPQKQGSFHLYFYTDRLIPVMHFPYAKLDLMGNARNAAVYLKNKQSNGIPRAVLTEEIWLDIRNYVNQRKEQR